MNQTPKRRGRPKGESKLRLGNISFRHDQDAWLDKAQEKLGKSRSAIVREALDKYIEENPLSEEQQDKEDKEDKEASEKLQVA
jgi:predicted DNA-binding protein